MNGTSHTKKDAQTLANLAILQSDMSLSLNDIAAFELAICGRYRVYPREPSQIVTVATDALADTYGNWTEVIAANIIPIPFNIIGVIIESISATGRYMLQFGDCAAGLTPVDSEIQGEIRFVGTAPVARSTEIISFGCREIAANRRVMARVKNDSGGDSVTVSVIVRQYIEMSHETTPTPTWPW